MAYSGGGQGAVPGLFCKPRFPLSLPPEPSARGCADPRSWAAEPTQQGRGELSEVPWAAHKTMLKPLHRSRSVGWGCALSHPRGVQTRWDSAAAPRSDLACWASERSLFSLRLCFF